MNIHTCYVIFLYLSGKMKTVGNIVLNMTQIRIVEDFYKLYKYLFFFKGTSASIVLNQKNAETAEVGKSIELRCEVSGYNINDHHMHWIRQADGGKLVWVAAFRTGFNTEIAGSFKGRVTPSTSGSTALLKIDRLTKSDTARYHCARQHNEEVLVQPWLKSARLGQY